MRNLLRQTWRGCGDLPHVGEHPGTLFLIVLLFAGAAAGGFGGLAIMAVCILPFYLLGANERAQLSDRISAKENER